GGAGRRLDGRDRAALRRVVRTGHVDGARRGTVRAGPPAQVPGGRRRRRCVVLHPRRRRGRGNGQSDRARPPGRLQHRRRRSRAGRGVASLPRAATRRQGAEARTAVRRARVRRKDGRRDDDRIARCLQRQGQARAGVAAELSELAAGVRRGMTERERLLDELRPVSFAIAYRMLGSVSDAEHVVQEALLRVHRALETGEQIRLPRAFVATVTTRLAINELHSARTRREHYVGEWLPEPIITDRDDDPARHTEMADSLSLAMLVLLESLSPEQRAVLLLHDVFDYDYPQVAEIIGKSQDNVRQLATRARQQVEQRRPRFQTTREQRDELARWFFAAAEQGDLAGLEALLAHDVELTTDGGGKVPALARTLRGRSRVARAVINWARLPDRVPGVSLRPVEVNGSPGALYLDAQQRLIAV